MKDSTLVPVLSDFFFFAGQDLIQAVIIFNILFLSTAEGNYTAATRQTKER